VFPQAETVYILKWFVSVTLTFNTSCSSQRASWNWWMQLHTNHRHTLC